MKRVPQYKPTPLPRVRPRATSATARASKRFYNGKAWLACRLAKLRDAPLCEDCIAKDRVTAATQVHHVVKQVQRPDLAYDPDNLRSLCASCHGKYNARGE